MAFKTFCLPVRDPEPGERDLNGFLRSHRVLTVTRQWVELGENSFWSILVDYIESRAEVPPGQDNGGFRSRIDYRERLKPEDFDVFVEMRKLRTQLAQEEGVPVYRVWTNDQMANMVENRVRTKADLERISGFGESRIGKYGPRVLEFLNGMWSQADEKSRKPDAPDR